MFDFKFYSIYLRTGEKAQGIKCLLCKYQDLSSDSHCLFKRLGVAVYVCNTSTGETKIGGFLGLGGQPTYLNC